MALVALDPFDQVVPLDPHDSSGSRDPLDPLAEVLTGRAGDVAGPGTGGDATRAARSSTSTGSDRAPR